jgi:hypothetical protein
MIDPFVVLTPALVLVVMALVSFIGCDRVLGLEPIGPIPSAPTFSPGAGTYFSLSQGVAISAVSGAKIYFTTDGSTPTADSTLYNGTPVSLPAGKTTLNAIAVASGTPSSVTTAIYYVGPIAWVQKVETAGLGATSTPPFPGLSRGDMIVVWIFYNSNTVQVASVSDGQNSYIRACPPTSMLTTPPFSQEIWFAFNIGLATNVQVSVTFTGTTPSEVQISAHEYSNAYQENDSSLGPLAEMPPPGVTGTGPNVATNSVISNGRLAFGAAIFQSTGTHGSAFTSRSTLHGDVAEDMNITAPDTTVAAKFVNNTGPDQWVAQMITLK